MIYSSDFDSFWVSCLHVWTNGLKDSYLCWIIIYHVVILIFILYFKFFTVHLCIVRKSFVHRLFVVLALAIFGKMAPPWILTMELSWFLGTYKWCPYTFYIEMEIPRKAWKLFLMWCPRRVFDAWLGGHRVNKWIWVDWIHKMVQYVSFKRREVWGNPMWNSKLPLLVLLSFLIDPTGCCLP